MVVSALHPALLVRLKERIVIQLSQLISSHALAGAALCTGCLGHRRY
jgi:hypothetical protein